MAKKKFQWEADSGLKRDELPPPPDRAKRRRDGDESDKLVQELVALPLYERRKLPIEPEVLEGLAEIDRLMAKAAVRGGMRRQRLYVAGLLRHTDLDALREAMPSHGGVSLHEHQLQLAEHWRRRLVGGGDDTLGELLDEFPQGDRQQLRQRIRQAKKEVAAEKPGKAFKALFQDVRALLEG